MSASTPSASPTSLAFLPIAAGEIGLSAPLTADILLLDRLFGKVLEAQHGPELLDLARRLFEDTGAPATLADRLPELRDAAVVERLLRAFTVFFQLLNTAEQKEIIRVNRERQARNPEQPRRESIADAVRRMRDAGVTAPQMEEHLSRIFICPTLTAHPTEARRRAVLDKLLSIAQWLVEAAQPAALPRLDAPLNAPAGGADRVEQELTRTLTALWQTDELRASPITVMDEVRNGLYFFEHSIMDVVPWLHDDLHRALADAYPGHAFQVPPFLQYRSWVGGDRDGNPNVTADITWTTLLAHKGMALRHYQAAVGALQRELTQSLRLAPPSEELARSLEADAAAIPLPELDRSRLASEPYGLKLRYMAARLEATLSHLSALTDFRAEGPAFEAQAPAYHSAGEFLEELRVIQRSLEEGHAEAVAAHGALEHLAVQVQTFGFHLAALDVRQHSDEHAAVLDELLVEAQVLAPGARYSDLPEAEKVRLLTRELCNPRPLLGRGWTGSETAQRTLQLFEVIRHGRRYIAPESVVCYIISMTHGVSDMLEVLLLAKEQGLLRWTVRDGEPHMECDLDVIPLFETIDDLTGCDTLMRRLFVNRAYRHQLQARGDFQEIMLGYSDSSKDGGYLAANWALHSTQSRLSRACRDAGVAFRFFHGRGGTVGRGGGRANQAILSQPAGSFSGGIRFTEQGEIVSFRYSLPPIAHRHLEQIVGAVLVATADLPPRRRVKKDWTEAARRMADHSRGVYRALVYDDPEFWDFYTQATPIEHIGGLTIASRPVFRPGKGVGSPANLRAVPWVFAWVQSRYVLPGWYGLGSALEWLAEQDPDGLKLLREMYRLWPFFRTVIDNAQLELVRAHLPTAAWYASRVDPPEVGQRFHARIQEEYTRTLEWTLHVTEERELLDNARVVRDTVALRNPVTEPLSKLQVALLEAWDAREEQGQPQLEGRRDAILLSIIGVAAAMQSTG
jgi:phosphoenolpyruvate carboxylase